MSQRGRVAFFCFIELCGVVVWCSCAGGSSEAPVTPCARECSGVRLLQEGVRVVVTAEGRATRATYPILSLFGGCHALGGRLVRAAYPRCSPLCMEVDRAVGLEAVRRQPP